jgi:hypothetical protein
MDGWMAFGALGVRVWDASVDGDAEGICQGWVRALPANDTFSCTSFRLHRVWTFEFHLAYLTRLFSLLE